MTKIFFFYANFGKIIKAPCGSKKRDIDKINNTSADIHTDNKKIVY